MRSDRNIELLQRLLENKFSTVYYMPLRARALHAGRSNRVTEEIAARARTDATTGIGARTITSESELDKFFEEYPVSAARPLATVVGPDEPLSEQAWSRALTEISVSEHMRDRMICALVLVGIPMDEIVEILGKNGEATKVSKPTVSRIAAKLPQNLRRCLKPAHGRFAGLAVFGLLPDDLARSFWKHFSTCEECQALGEVANRWLSSHESGYSASPDHRRAVAARRLPSLSTAFPVIGGLSVVGVVLALWLLSPASSPPVRPALPEAEDESVETAEPQRRLPPLHRNAANSAPSRSVPMKQTDKPATASLATAVPLDAQTLVLYPEASDQVLAAGKQRESLSCIKPDPGDDTPIFTCFRSQELCELMAAGDPTGALSCLQIGASIQGTSDLQIQCERPRFDQSGQVDTANKETPTPDGCRRTRTDCRLENIGEDLAVVRLSLAPNAKGVTHNPINPDFRLRELLGTGSSPIQPDSSYIIVPGRFVEVDVGGRICASAVEPEVPWLEVAPAPGLNGPTIRRQWSWSEAD